MAQADATHRMGLELGWDGQSRIVVSRPNLCFIK
jgi:hypothetical protein